MTTQNVLLLRPDNIGDCVLFSGALAPIRQHWPNARIELAVQPVAREWFRYCPHVDCTSSILRFMPWKVLRRHCSHGSWRLQRFLQRGPLRYGWLPHYDVVLYPVSSPVEEWLEVVRFLPAKEKLGVGGVQTGYEDLEDPANQPERVFTRLYRNRPEDTWSHEIDRTREVLSTFGILGGQLWPEMWLLDQDRGAAAALGTSVLGFFIGAGSPFRQWPVVNWAELAARQNVAARIAIFGSLGDRRLAGEIMATATLPDDRWIDMTGRTTLREMAACLAACRAVVSTDSVGLHMAVAARRPTVGILGGYHWGRFYPWGDPNINRVASKPMACFHCNNACVYGDFRCVRDVDVPSVLKELTIAIA